MTIINKSTLIDVVEQFLVTPSTTFHITLYYMFYTYFHIQISLLLQNKLIHHLLSLYQINSPSLPPHLATI